MRDILVLEEMYNALVSAEKYMTRQRAKSKSPFDPEALKQVRRAISNYERAAQHPMQPTGGDAAEPDDQAQKPASG